ncbi:hypothetical protein LINPERPRIM_LOCUS7508 [Linum perenne]
MLKRIAKQNTRSSSSKNNGSQPMRSISSGQLDSTQNVPDLGRQVEEDEQLQPVENIDQDSENETIEVEPRKTRGPTVLADIWNLRPGEELPEEFNIYNQCVDDGQLGNFCGTIARNSELTPLQYNDWRIVPSHIKEEIWRVVKSKFNLSPIRRSWVLKQVGKCLREFKHTLYSENFYKYKSFAELKAHVDPRVKQAEWEALVEIWYSKEWQKKAAQNKSSRKIMKLPHTSGTISLARRTEMEYKSTGKRPSRVKLFVKYHQHKDGKAVTPEAAAIIEKIQNAQSRESVGEDNSPLEEEAVNIRDDLLAKLIRPDKNGRVLGMGFGVSPSTFSKENLNVLHENQRLNDSNKELQQTVGKLNDQVAQLGELMVKFIGSTNATFLQQVPSAQPFLNSLSERNEQHVNTSSTTAGSAS